MSVFVSLWVGEKGDGWGDDGRGGLIHPGQGMKHKVCGKHIMHIRKSTKLTNIENVYLNFLKIFTTGYN